MNYDNELFFNDLQQTIAYYHRPKFLTFNFQFSIFNSKSHVRVSLHENPKYFSIYFSGSMMFQPKPNISKYR